MDIRKIKLALTVDLMNESALGNSTKTARSAMARFGPEAGDYKETIEKFRTVINDDLVQSTKALVFEHCTLDLNLIFDQKRSKELLQGFNLYENLS